jgi:hypothetical protein
VRRAGLKPGLDRSFGCEPELLGLVVAQEPAAGDDLARNGMVILYVAAPGNAPMDEDTDVRPEGLGPASASVASPPVVVLEVDAPQAPPRVRRPRKPGLAEREPPVFDIPPAPIGPGRGLAGEAEAAAADDAPTEASVSEAQVDAPIPPEGEEYDEGVSDDRVDDEPSHEEFVVHADDVFAGRASRGLPAWRRVYPRKRTVRALGGRRVRARLAEHPLLVRAAGGMLAVWAVVGVAVALAGHPARMHAASVPERDSDARAIRRRVEPPAPEPKVVRPVGVSARAHVRPRDTRAHRRPPRPAAAKRAVARPAGARVRAAPSPRLAPSAAAASTPSAPVQEQTQGGLFSP